jgi:hypothetical protein
MTTDRYAGHAAHAGEVAVFAFLSFEVALGRLPAVVGERFAALDCLRQEGMPLLLVDQMAALALSLADRVYLVEGGRSFAQGNSAQIAADGALAEAYPGGLACCRCWVGVAMGILRPGVFPVAEWLGRTLGAQLAATLKMVSHEQNRNCDEREAQHDESVVTSRKQRVEYLIANLAARKTRPAPS